MTDEMIDIAVAEFEISVMPSSVAGPFERLCAIKDQTTRHTSCAAGGSAKPADR